MVSLLDMVTTALLSSITMAGSSRGIRSSWQRVGDDKVEVGEDGASFGISRRGCDSGLFDATVVVKCTVVGAIEGCGVAGIAFTVRVKKIRGVNNLTIKAEDAENILMEDVANVWSGS